MHGWGRRSKWTEGWIGEEAEERSTAAGAEEQTDKKHWRMLERQQPVLERSGQDTYTQAVRWRDDWEAVMRLRDSAGEEWACEARWWGASGRSHHGFDHRSPGPPGEAGRHDPGQNTDLLGWATGSPAEGEADGSRRQAAAVWREAMAGRRRRTAAVVRQHPARRCGQARRPGSVPRRA